MLLLLSLLLLGLVVVGGGGAVSQNAWRVSVVNLIESSSKTLRFGNLAAVWAIVGTESQELLDRMMVWRLGKLCGAERRGSRDLIRVFERSIDSMCWKMGSAMSPVMTLVA